MVITDLSPSAQIYLPYIYIIWADGLLTASELSVIRSVISVDSNLRGREKTVLLNWLLPEQPPSEEQFEEWKQLIHQNNGTVSLEAEYPLADFSSRLFPEEIRKTLNIEGLKKLNIT